MEDKDLQTSTTDYSDPYLTTKENYKAEIDTWISDAETELADLYLRKKILEADFPTLLEEYKRYILADEKISTIAKTNLITYFSYDLLKPFKSVGLEQTEHYNTWETRHFYTAYQLDEQKNLVFYFKLKVVDERFVVDYLPLITLNVAEMTVKINDKHVRTLISLWYSDKFLSRSQLSLFNQDINELLKYFKSCGFEVLPSLLDNTQALSLRVVSNFPVSQTTLDRIFITTMENEEYDFELLGEETYQVLLNQEQNMIIYRQAEQTELFIDSNNRRRSILDFATSYPFLVPLFVEGNA